MSPVRQISATQRWIEHRLGPPIDAAAIDGHRTLAQRLFVGLLAAVLVATNLGISVGSTWLFICYGGEGLAWIASRRQLRGLPGVVMERGVYLLCVAVNTLNWAFLPLLYWLSGRPGLQYVAIVIASAMLIHAQAFTFRSRAMLAIQAGIPAGVLVTLMLVYSKLAGLEWLTAAVGVMATLGYVVGSARANRAAARALAESREELERIAFSDSLTGLSNRRRFGEDMHRLTEQARRQQQGFALVLIDLDRFKEINDQLGHDVGDALLVAVASRLKALATTGDRVARLGGDEFAMLVADVGDGAGAAERCQQIVESIRDDVDVNGVRLQATSSVGYAVYPVDGRSQTELYKAADLALYASKRAGRDTWRAFEPEAIAAE